MRVPDLLVKGWPAIVPSASRTMGNRTPAAVAVQRVDVDFALLGAVVPRDHGYSLFGAMSRVVGNLHGAEWLAVHPLPGVPVREGLLRLEAGRASLRVRIVPAEIPRILPFVGKTLVLDGAQERH